MPSANLNAGSAFAAVSCRISSPLLFQRCLLYPTVHDRHISTGRIGRACQRVAIPGASGNHWVSLLCI